jgi:O-methyltransferase
MPLPDANAANFLEILRAERRDLIDRLRQTQFTTLKRGYSQAQIIPHSSYSPWMDDQGFLRLHDAVKGSTMVDVYRCHELYSLVRQLASIPGDLVEVGVWRGGTAALIAGAAPEKAMHLFDTFAGVAKADTSHDTLYTGGEHADTTAAEVEELFARLALKCTLRIGTFPDQTGEELPPAICFAHIDVDTYSSAKDSFSAIWPRIPPGGVVVFDDYGFWGCEGVTQAVHEIRAGVEHALLVHNLNGHAVLVRTH